MSSAAEEAIQKARTIAARLSGDNTGATADTQHALDIAAAAQAVLESALGQPAATDVATSSSAASKRKRWGVADDTAAEVLPGLEDAAKRLKATAAPLQRRVWVDTSNKPAGHFASYLTEGDKTQHIVGELHPDLSIQLKGRGSSKNPPPPGMPEEPLHVLIEGPPEVVSKAETMVEDLLHQAEAAPLQQSNDDPSSIAENAADAHDSSNGTPGYTPAPVAALIHGTTFAGNHYGNYGEMLEEQIGVPNGVVGFIIGRGGENITSMQARSGCKIQIQKENEMTPGQTQRVITLTATTKESIDSCRGMIEAMVQDRIRTTNSSVSMASAMSTPGGGGTQAAKLQEAIVAGHQLVTVIVPDGDVGLIIGRSGTTIRDIQDRSGANIQIPQQGDADNPTVRTVSITHPHLEGAQAAKQMIEQMLASKSQQNSFGPQTSLQVMVRDMFMLFLLEGQRTTRSSTISFFLDSRQRCGNVHWPIGLRHS
jgi:far upstream element-binding protein